MRVVCTLGRRVGDVMTENPVVVRAATDMTSAARMLLDTRVSTCIPHMQSFFPPGTAGLYPSGQGLFWWPGG